MKLKMTGFTVAVFLFLAPLSPSQKSGSYTFDGNELLRNCNAAVKLADGADVAVEESVEALQCLQYLAGFRDGYRLAVSLSDRGYGNPLCMPAEGVENQQAARIVAKWLRENPDQLHESAHVSVLIALSGAFPCE